VSKDFRRTATAAHIDAASDVAMDDGVSVQNISPARVVGRPLEGPERAVPTVTLSGK
jgi:hypothetical protein